MKTCESVRASLHVFKDKGCIPYSTRKLFQKKIKYCNDTLDIPGFDDNVVLDDEIKCLPECNKVEYIFTRSTIRDIDQQHYIKYVFH